jgi:hypothetical protein
MNEAIAEKKPLPVASEAAQTAQREKASNVVQMDVDEGAKVPDEVEVGIDAPEVIRKSTTLQPAAKGAGVIPDHPCAAHVEIVDADEAIVVGGRHKIAVTGFATSSRQFIADKVNKPAWEIWGLNQFYRHVADEQGGPGRADRWFEIHENWDEHVVEGTDYVPDLNAMDIPIYMTQRRPEIPKSVTYPKTRLAAKWADYFTSTVAFMLAAAIEALIDPKTDRAYPDAELGIYGIDLTVGEEYEYQKPCAEFWVGIAVALGITVDLPEESAMCKATWTYGYESEPSYGVIGLSLLEKRLASLRAQRHKAVATVNTLDGCIQEAEHYHRILDLKKKGAVVMIGGTKI